MHRRTAVSCLVALSAAAAGACAPTAEQQAAALGPASSAVAARSRQSWRFETGDQALMLQSVIGALQDLGFTIEESQAATGVVVGSKLAGARLRAQVSVRSLPGQAGTLVRATFQRIIPRPGAMLALGETLDDPALYQGFFERVAQSAFLTAHEI
ncbi:MAG TPA: hypothetical protein VNR89_02600 [Roseomonas sp.]|nr:hypothetical protein [Roseomonas sp.]